MIKRFKNYNNNRIIEKYKYQLLNIIYESTDTCPVDEPRSYKRKKLKKAFGERNADMILSKLSITKYPIDKVIEYLRNKLPIKSTMIDIVESLPDIISDGFLKSMDIEEENIEVKGSLQDLLKKVNYSVEVIDSVDEAIKKYKKYYKNDEVICTMKSNTRFLESYITFFKHNDIDTTHHANDLTQDNINSEWSKYLERKGRKNDDGSYDLMGLKPNPLDPYSTSLLCVQISKKGRTLKTISRYNHTINNPDYVYSNLDNIIDGLHTKFYSYFNVEVKRQEELPVEYVMDSDKRLFKYQGEVNGNYFGDGFIIKSDGETVFINKDYQLLIDGTLYDINKPYRFEAFGNSLNIGNITKIIPKGNNQYLINVRYLNDNYTALITVVDSQITEFQSDDIKVVGNNFLYSNEVLTSISLPNVREIGKEFLAYNYSLTSISLPNVREIGNNFLVQNQALTSISLPNVREIGNNFIYNNKVLTSISLPNVREIGNNFLVQNQALTSISLPNVREIGKEFLYDDKVLDELELPRVHTIGSRFLYNNDKFKNSRSVFTGG